MDRRVVITGAGVICPLGIQTDDVWQALLEGKSGIQALTCLPGQVLPSPVGGEARDFSGDIENYGSLDKPLMRSIKKGRKLMCREIEMGVAAAQRAMQSAQLESGSFEPERTGVVFGSDYIMSAPEEFISGIKNCRDESGHFDFARWGEDGMSKVEPLWLLKYLPNMPASHIAIYNDLRGPSNSITLREASSNLSVAEAFTAIQRGAADVMLAGSTGTRIHRLRTLHVSLQEQLARPDGDPATCCRPFDRNRTGMVIGEGAGAIVLETLESAQRRGVPILGEVISHASTCASRNQIQENENRSARRAGSGYVAAADYRTAFRNVLRRVLAAGEKTAPEIGHLNAHGQASIRCDQEEAHAIAEVFADRTEPIPVVAAKSAMGNLGAGSGMVELIGSVFALNHGKLFPVQNYHEPDPECPIHPVTDANTPAGDCFVTCNVTPQGQASALLIAKFDG